MIKASNLNTETSNGIEAVAAVRAAAQQGGREQQTHHHF